MSASLLNVLKKFPAPLFGNAAIAAKFGMQKASRAPRYAPWALPAVVGGLWFVWPAVDEEWKQSIGIGSAPAEAAAPAAKDEAKGVEPIILSEEAKEKVEKAYVVETVELTEEEKAVMKSVAQGDFTVLEKDWETFNVKAMNPEEDDDDDDDEEEEDEEEEDEEGEEDEE